MSLRDFARLLLRWKWVLVPGLLLALVGGAAVFLATPPEYTRTETYLLLSPVQTETGPTNPFLNTGNGVAMTAAVLAAKVSDGDTVRELTADAPDLEYTVAVDNSVSESLLRVSATDEDREVVTATLLSLGERLGTELVTLQQTSGAPANSFVTITPFTEDPKTTTGYGDPIRNGVGAGIGLVLLVMLVLVLLERGRLRRLARNGAPDTDTDTDLPEPDETGVVGARTAVEQSPAPPVAETETEIETRTGARAGTAVAADAGRPAPAAPIGASRPPQPEGTTRPAGDPPPAQAKRSVSRRMPIRRRS